MYDMEFRIQWPPEVAADEALKSAKGIVEKAKGTVEAMHERINALLAQNDELRGENRKLKARAKKLERELRELEDLHDDGKPVEVPPFMMGCRTVSGLTEEE